MIATLVRRGSQVHHVFQIGRAHRDPVSNTRVVNTTPISTLVAPATSQRRSLRSR